MDWNDYLNTLGWNRQTLGQYSYQVRTQRNGIQLTLRDRQLPALQLEFSDRPQRDSLLLEKVLSTPVYLRVEGAAGTFEAFPRSVPNLPTLFDKLLKSGWKLVQFNHERLKVLGISDGKRFIPWKKL